MKDNDQWEVGNKLGDPMISSAYCLEKVSRPGHRERGAKLSLEDFSSWKDTAESQGRPRQLELAG